jgi:hypothetical protein
MADMTKPIFNRAATDKLRSPDDLDKYVRVTNPSVWVILAACIALLVGLLAWGVFGAVTTNVSATGVSIDGRAMCFLTAEDVAKVHVGDNVSVNGEGMTVAKVATVPVSRDEAHGIMKSDYLVSTLVNGDWVYQVTFEGDASDLPDSVPLSVNITTDQIPPIRLILGGNA